MSLRRSDGPNIDPTFELQSIRYAELLFRRQEWALGHAPIARVQEHESAPEWYTIKISVPKLLRLRALAYWAEANEATEAEKHAALRLRVRHRRIKVAAAFLCHTRFDDAITEKIVSFFPCPCRLELGNSHQRDV